MAEKLISEMKDQIRNLFPEELRMEIVKNKRKETWSFELDA